MKLIVLFLIVIMAFSFVMASRWEAPESVLRGTIDKVVVEPGIFDNGIQFIDGEWKPIVVD